MKPRSNRSAVFWFLLSTTVMLLMASALSSWSAPRATAQTAGSARLSAAHPSSDPLWLPLRTAATIGCAVSNCPTSSHHYWAIDFIGRRGEPIYSAGAGIAHVGGTSGGGCSSTSSVGDGNWIWVDHGGGLVTKYHHLDKILISNGQRVSPATEIATMGHSGDVRPCTTNYLHFEIRKDGLTGPRVAIPSMAACSSRGRVDLPRLYGENAPGGAGTKTRILGADRTGN